MIGPIENVYDPKHLELLVVVYGLRLAKDITPTSFTIESNYLEVVCRVNNAEEDFFEVGHIC